MNILKAAVCRSFATPLSLEEVSISAPGPHEVLIDTKACAICHSDILFIDGAWGGDLPAVYGHEASGVVTAVGVGVTDFKPGDRVAATLIRSCGQCHHCDRGEEVICETQFPLDAKSPLEDGAGTLLAHGMRIGAFASQMLVHESQIVGIPDQLSFESASLLSCGVITGFGAVKNTAPVPKGANVVIVGTGGVGLNAVQGAVHQGAAKIIALDIADDKLAAAEKFGATHLINGKTSDAVAEVKALTGGRGADFCFVTVGSGAALAKAQDLICNGGAVVIVGMPPSDVRLDFDPSSFAAVSKRLYGSKMGSSRVKVDIPYLVDLYEKGDLKLDELVSQTYAFDDINDALEATRKGQGLRNVVVF